jgi:hypothetical protein
MPLPDMLTRILWLALVSCSVMCAAERTPSPAEARTFVVGVSPFLDKGVKDDIYRSLVRLLVQDLPLNSSVEFYDAFFLKTIARVEIPEAVAFRSPKTRANQFASAIRDLKQFLAQEHARPMDKKLKFEAAVRLPQLCDFLLENLPQSNQPWTLLLIGSPLYQDQKEPGFSMVDGYFPSDGHLHSSRDKSVFGLADARKAPRGFAAHWVYFGDPWSSDLYHEKVTRFWTLYFEGRGGELRTFCGDLPTAIDHFRHDSAAPDAGQHWALDPQQTKIEMLRIGREVDVTDWIERDSIPEVAQGPPTGLLGPMKIGIRWKDNIDLDLYATARPGAETLFFQHPRAPEGLYYKDHRSSPGREYEFIEFDTPVDARQVEAFVNFYKGQCPAGPRGEVRIEFENRIYAAPFSISSAAGNRGRTGPSQQDWWTKIPIQQILKLSHASAE